MRCWHCRLLKRSSRTGNEVRIREAYNRWQETFQDEQRHVWKLIRPTSATLEEWEMVRVYQRRLFPIRYFFQETLMHIWWRFAGKASRGYYWVKCFLFNPHNVLKIPTLPPTWCDSVERIPHLLFTELTNFIERERDGEEGMRDIIDTNLDDVVSYYEGAGAVEAYPYIRWMPLRDYLTDKQLFDAYMWWKEQKAKGWAHGGPDIREFVKDDRKYDKLTAADFDPPVGYQPFLPIDELVGFVGIDRKYYQYDQAEEQWKKERDEHLKTIIELKGAMWT